MWTVLTVWKKKKRLNDLCAEYLTLKKWIEVCFQPDIIFSGWLGSRHQLTSKKFHPGVCEIWGWSILRTEHLTKTKEKENKREMSFNEVALLGCGIGYLFSLPFTCCWCVWYYATHCLSSLYYNQVASLHLPTKMSFDEVALFGWGLGYLFTLPF